MSSGIKKYSGILLKGTVAVSIANASTKIAGVLLLPVLTYYLSPQDYGIFAMFSLIINVLALFYNPGMMSATMRLYHSTQEEDERKTLIGSAHRFFLIIPIIPIAIGFIWGPLIFDNLFKDFAFYPYGMLALILAFFIQPKRIWSTLLTLQYKIHITAIYTGATVLVSLLLTVLLVVVFHMGALGKVLAMFPGAIFLFIVSLITINKYTQGNWSFSSIKRQLLFGLPLIIALWSYEVFNVAGKYFLEHYEDLTSVGLYSFGLAVAQVPMFLVLGVKQLWNPIFYENMNKKDYSTVSKLITIFVGGLTLLNLSLVLFSKEAIILLVNHRYYDAIPIIGLLVLGIYFNGLITISNSVLGYKNKFGMISVFASIAAAVYLGLNLFLVPKIGMTGAALSTAISYFIFFILGIWHQRKTLSIIQKPGIILLPITIMILSILILWVFSSHFAKERISFFELFWKFLILTLTIFMFFRVNILNKAEFIYAYSSLKKKITKKK